MTVHDARTAFVGVLIGLSLLIPLEGCTEAQFDDPSPGLADSEFQPTELVPGPPTSTFRRLDEPTEVTTETADETVTETLYRAIRDSWITATFVGTGASSGDAITVRVAKTQGAPPGRLALTVSPGAMLHSVSPGAQNMVVTGVRGRDLGDGRFTPESQIDVSGTDEVTYILSAYCAEFEKDNPSEGDTFVLVEARDPVLACIAIRGETLSLATAQAAVWMHTDQMTFSQMRERFEITEVEWADAESAFRSCR